MGLSFSASLFGLAGSLVLGFLDLQAGQAQNRFYTELEDWLATSTMDTPADTSLRPGTPHDLTVALNRLTAAVNDGAGGRAATQAMANLAEGIQGLVQHMRAEQQMIRDWVEAQADPREGAEAGARPPRPRKAALMPIPAQADAARRAAARSITGRASSTPCRRCCSPSSS